ncbi:MAG: xanthine dehydrogenase family protein molybdopterin-binding subunit [Gammaproteobacteria bacterium]|nr:xanthine dehydrogenase family protein molybdopterin-binding subunit [Gammaproteobacteria bacterium]
MSQYKARKFNVVGQRLQRPDGIDKVTGRARYGADMDAAGMLHAKVLRSPHAHARIISIDTSAAAALPGVMAVITRADFPLASGEYIDLLDHCMAGDRALYDGHAVAAVAATSKRLAKQALKLIKVDYELLPHVTDIEAAIAPGAPVIHAGVVGRGVPKGYSDNVTRFRSFGHGDIEAGFQQADVVVERTYRTEATHQGYIEPHACVATMGMDGRGDLWVCTQGHFAIRNMCAAILGMESASLRVTASEIGGGFGGKTTVCIEPLALALAKKSGRAVKLVMTRDEVLRATGPTVSTLMHVKLGMNQAGRITAAYAQLFYQSGAYRGYAADFGAMPAFAPYALENVHTEGFDVMTNRPKSAAYRAPGAPPACYAAESAIDEAAHQLGLDPLAVRLLNAAREGSKSSYGPTYAAHGLVECLQAAQQHPHWRAPLGENMGRGIAAGFWFNFGGDTCVSAFLNPDGSISVSEGNPDIGGSRASISMMVAEEMGIPYEQVRTTVADTGSMGQNEPTHGSRVTFAVGLAAIKSARAIIAEIRHRLAQLWEVDIDSVVWQQGCASCTDPNSEHKAPMDLRQVAAIASNTGGPIGGHHEVNAEGAGVSFGVHIADTEVDPQTGHISIKRYTVIQDAGKAIQPDYVEGQLQGGAVQGIGWALNEEYIYGEDGRLQNSGFLDYRIPVASDLPMIDTVIVEVPNPGHPYGVRGVGETPIVPPLAAVANAVTAATGVRQVHLPMSPPRVLAGLQAK